MEIAIKNLQKKIPLSQIQISKTAKRALSALDVQDADLSLVFTTDQKIRVLNKKYLKRSYATDVLAFDFCKGGVPKKKLPRQGSFLAGEIVISTDTVYKNSRLFGVSAAQELKLCLVHGILHLLGYDDHKPGDIKRMRRKEQEILKRLSP